MLPASQTDASPQVRVERRDDRALLMLVIGLMAYTFLIGLGVLLGRISPDSALLYMVLACLAPAAWYAYGFLQVREVEQDFGVLLSAIGWALAAMALLFKYNAVRLAMNASDATNGSSSASTVCAWLAFGCLLAGAALSLHAWNQRAAG